jgi:hypothetical protein
MEDSDEVPKQRKISNIFYISRDIFQSFGLRCPIEISNRYDRKLLVFNFHFLPIISILLYSLLLLG